CPWHSGALGVIRGLEKNGFAGCRYSVGILLAFTILAIGFSWGPILSGAAVTCLAAWGSVAPVAPAASAASGASGASGVSAAVRGPGLTAAAFPLTWPVILAGWAPFVFQCMLLVAGWAYGRKR